MSNHTVANHTDSVSNHAVALPSGETAERVCVAAAVRSRAELIDGIDPDSRRLSAIWNVFTPDRDLDSATALASSALPHRNFTKLSAFHTRPGPQNGMRRCFDNVDSKNDRIHYRKTSRG